MTRCSHCSDNGHNTRTYPTRPAALSSSASSSSSSSHSIPAGVKIFGVKLIDGSIFKKSASMDNLTSGANSNPDSSSLHNPLFFPDECVSDDPSGLADCSSTVAPRRIPRDRKKGVPWTEEEHRRFLFGLQKLGKGDWRGISRGFVKSKTPTQVASHAQKHFLRRSNASIRKRRSSLFDMVEDASRHQVAEKDHEVTSSEEPFPSLTLSLSIEASPCEDNGNSSCVPGHYQSPVPFPAPHSFWPTSVSLQDGSRHELVKPLAVMPKKPVDAGDFRLSYLCFREMGVAGEGFPPVCLKRVGDSSRRSAFRANVAV